MPRPLSSVPPAASSLTRSPAEREPGEARAASPAATFTATPRRVAPYVLRALLDAQLAHRSVTLEDLVELFPVRRADLRRTLSALHASDLYDIRTGRLTLRGFAVALAVRDQSRVPIRTALMDRSERLAPTIRIRPEPSAVRRTG